MSFLDTLSRATDSPATDYHLCIFNNPNQREEIYNFFSDQKTSRIIQEISALEIRLCKFDRKQENPGLDDSDERLLIYQNLISCKADYKDLLQNFQVEKLNKVHNLYTEKAKLNNKNKQQDGTDSDINQSHSKQSASDFLLSLAGIFDSGLKDTSENVEAIVMDFIVKKHERQ